MAEYAPESLRWLAKQVCEAIPSAQLAGIIGDSRHKYGYHRARAVVSSSDYSVRTQPDKEGDRWAASAIDIKLNATWMKTITNRLLASAKDNKDPRLNYVREFFGTTNGSSVAGWDTYYGKSSTSDSSHLWHIHISFLRRYATSRAAAEAVLSVIKGEPLMALTARDVWRYDPGDPALNAIANPPWREDHRTNPTVSPAFAVYNMWTLVYAALQGVNAIKTEQAAAKIRDQAILTAIQDSTAEILAAIQGQLNSFRDELVAGLGPSVLTAVREQIGTITAEALATASKTALREVLGGLDNFHTDTGNTEQ